ncbi:hypothetical protein DdX_06414 [Ditylenchus destructor]|uniref:Uncharacterized protein n=1 Tax=Ditylenchus destructor TaxID=166010 RepID=A0AAD4N935_9BILA|nr:hypothetical protein DdX_06414 [Ditylenchus destructor]
MSDSIENMSFLESTENSDSDIHDANIAATQDHDMSSTDGESWKLVDNSSDDDDSESADNEIVKWGSQLDMEAYEMENRSGEFNSEKDSPASVTQNQEVLSLISFDDAEMVSIVTAESTVTELPSTSTAASYPLVIRNNPWRKFAKHNVHKQNVKKCSHSSFNTKATLNCRISSIQHASPDSNLHRCCNAPKFGNTKIIPSTTVELATRKEFMDKVKKALQSDTTVVAENGTANKPPTGAQANAQIQAIMSNQMNDAEKTADRFSGTSRQQQSTLFNSNLYWTENPPKTSNMNILTSNKPKLVTHEEFAANVKEVRSDDAEKMTKLEASKEERLNLDLTMQVKRDLKNFIEKAVQNDASLLQQQSDSKDRDTHNAGTSNDSVHKNTMTSNPDVIVKCSCVKCSRGQVYNGEQSRCQRQQCGKWHESFLPEIQRRKNSHMFRTQMYFPATEPFLNLGVPNPQDANAMKLARIMRATNECHNKFHLPRRSPIKKPSFERVQNPQEVETTNFVNILKEMNQNSKPVKSEGNNAELEENAHTNDHSPPSNKNEVQNNESEASEEFNPIAVEPAHMSENENFEDEGFVDDTEENEVFSWRWNITNCLVLMMVILISLSFGCFIQNYIYKKQEFATLQSSITELQSELIFLRHKNFVTTRQLSSIVELFNLPSDSNMGSIGPEPKTFRAKIMLLFSTIYVHLGYLFTALINQISKYSSWEQFLFYHMCFGGFFVMCYLATRLFSLVRILGGCFFRFIK